MIEIQTTIRGGLPVIARAPISADSLALTWTRLNRSVSRHIELFWMPRP